MSQGSSDIIQSLQASVGCDYFRELVSISAKRIANLIDKTSKAGKIITLFGNGGSAADAQHWAAELVCTYRSRSRQPVPAVALTTDSSILTAWSNDFDFSEVFSRQVRAFSRQNGLSIGISTSGRSPNVCTAVHTLGDLPDVLIPIERPF